MAPKFPYGSRVNLHTLLGRGSRTLEPTARYGDVLTESTHFTSERSCPHLVEEEDDDAGDLLARALER